MLTVVVETLFVQSSDHCIFYYIDSSTLHGTDVITQKCNKTVNINVKTASDVRYSKVSNYYYSIAGTSLSLNLFTYVISIASAGLGTPASL